MPLKLNRGDRKLLLIAGSILILMLIVSAFFAGGSTEKREIPTTYSSGSNGAKAAFLLLRSAGYDLQRWEQPLDELPDGSGYILVLADPSGSATSEQKKKLAEFIGQGGVVIATGFYSGFFLPQNGAEIEVFPGPVWKRALAQSPSRITRVAPQISMAPLANWDPNVFALPLYAENGKWRVVKYSYGKGEVLWWAAPTPLTNAGLKGSGDLEFFLACLGEPGSSHILWDEYFHGYQRSVNSRTRTPVDWIFVQFAFLALAILVTHSRRSGPICVPVPESRLSPLEFVRTLGALYDRAGAAAVAIEINYQRFRFWLTRRLGIAGNASVDQLEHAVRQRWDFTDPEFAATLRACEFAPYQTDLTRQAALQVVQSLFDYAVRLDLYETSKPPGKEKL